MAGTAMPLPGSHFLHWRGRFPRVEALSRVLHILSLTVLPMVLGLGAEFILSRLARVRRRPEKDAESFNDWVI